MERLIPKTEEERLMRVLSGQPCPDEKCEGVLLMTILFEEGLKATCRKCDKQVNLDSVKIVYEAENE